MKFFIFLIILNYVGFSYEVHHPFPFHSAKTACYIDSNKRQIESGELTRALGRACPTQPFVICKEFTEKCTSAGAEGYSTIVTVSCSKH